MFFIKKSSARSLPLGEPLALAVRAQFLGCMGMGLFWRFPSPGQLRHGPQSDKGCGSPGQPARGSAANHCLMEAQCSPLSILDPKYVQRGLVGRGLGTVSCFRKGRATHLGLQSVPCLCPSRIIVSHPGLWRRKLRPGDQSVAQGRTIGEGHMEI